MSAIAKNESEESEVLPTEWYDNPVVIAVGVGIGLLVFGYLAYRMLKADSSISNPIPTGPVIPQLLSVDEIADKLAGP